jgi:hypothetical protein
MTTWGVGAMPFNMQTKLERDEHLALVIQVTQARYAKAYKGIWIECNWKFTSNKTVWRKGIGLLTYYHDSKMIHGW